MAAKFTSPQLWSAAGVQGLVVYCSDGRWTEAFEGFVRQELRLRRFDRYVVPGGPSCLTLRGYQAEREYLTFLIREHGLERVVLIAHQGCTFYGRTTGLDPERCRAEQEEDLRRAMGIMAGWFPEVRVEGYLVSRAGSSLTFERVKER